MELIRSFWVTLNTYRMGGMSYNLWLWGLCAYRPCNHTLYDIPPILFVFEATQEDLISSLMMVGYCRNMYEPVYRIKKWYSQCILLVFSNTYNEQIEMEVNTKFTNFPLFIPSFLYICPSYSYQPSSSVGSHVLIPNNLSVLSSTKIIS
jgi:hypothetical protein